jgi:hypothetical protein
MDSQFVHGVSDACDRGLKKDWGKVMNLNGTANERMGCRWGVPLIAILLCVPACEKNLANALPKELEGDWVGDKAELKLTSGSIRTSDLICAGEFTLSSLTSSGTNNWDFKATHAGENTKGNIKLRADGKVEVSASGDSCFAKGLVGHFKRPETIRFPERVRSTWYSCDVKECSKVKVMFTEKTVVVTGSGGGKQCINGTATIKDVNIDGPITKIDHTGMTSSGSTMSIVHDGEYIELSGAGTFAGRYSKADCEASARVTDEAESAPQRMQRGPRRNENSEVCATDCLAENAKCVARCAGKDVCLADCLAAMTKCSVRCP